jgi:hypothetical protein
VINPFQDRRDIALRVVQRELAANGWSGARNWDDWCLTYAGMFPDRVSDIITGRRTARWASPWDQIPSHQEPLAELLEDHTGVPKGNWLKLFGAVQ